MSSRSMALRHSWRYLGSRYVRPKSRTLFARSVEPLGDDGQIRAILSTESVDRYGDVIEQDGWVLDQFLEHPVMVAGHAYGDPLAQIGEWQEVKVKGRKGRDRRLEGVGRYYVRRGNETADWAYEVARQGQAAYSVGFVPLKWEALDEADEWAELFGPFRFLEQELLEVSHVVVPANADATQLTAALQHRSLPTALVAGAFPGTLPGIPRRGREMPVTIEHTSTSDEGGLLEDLSEDAQRELVSRVLTDIRRAFQRTPNVGPNAGNPPAPTDLTGELTRELAASLKGGR